MAKKKKKSTRRVVKKKRRTTGRSLTSASVAALQAELARRLEKLHGRRDALAAELEAIEAEIAEHEGEPAPRRRAARATRRRPGRPPRKKTKRVAKKRATRKVKKKARTRRPRNTVNLADALRKLLTGKTMSVTEMAAAVQKAGYKTSSPNFRTIVNQTLINNKKAFKRVARGQYTAK